MATLAVFMVLAGGSAVALSGTNTVFSDDIVDGEVKSADLAVGAVGTSRTLDNSLQSVDIKDGQVKWADIGGSEITGSRVKDNSLTGNDIDEASLNSVEGRGLFLRNRIVRPHGSDDVRLLTIPSLGYLEAMCTHPARLNWVNDTGRTVDVWTDVGDTGTATLIPHGQAIWVVASGPGAVTGEHATGTITLGVGNDPNQRAGATLRLSVYKQDPEYPCGFQAQGTSWTAP